MLRVDADRADVHELLDAAQSRQLEDVGAHHQVRVPVATGVRAVCADSAHLGRKVEHHVGPCVVESPFGILAQREVVVVSPHREHVVAVLLQPFDEVRPEEAAAARDERSHVDFVATVGSRVIQSTRPIQRWRLAAYHSIVCATPSSHVTSGSQPVSAFSFS